LAVELSLVVPRGPRGPRIARRVAQERFGSELSEDQLERTLLIVSELTTNAIVHGRGQVRLRLALDGRDMHGEVIDEGGGLERRARTRGVDEIGGWGLDLVAAITDRWGIHEGSNHVWFRLGCGAGEAPPDEPELGRDERPSALD
jgi:anti-sigma regulatory factor (Ser/Thr protein kinase)